MNNNGDTKDEKSSGPYTLDNIPWGELKNAVTSMDGGMEPFLHKYKMVLEGIEHLDLSGYAHIHDKISDDNLSKLINACTGLSSLNISKFNGKFENVILLDRIKYRLNKITSLNISLCGDIAAHTLNAIAVISPGLESLDISGCTWDDSAAPCFRRFSKLKRLVACNCKTVDENTMKGIAKIPALTQLELRDCPNLDDRAVTHAASLQELNWLDVSGCPVTDRSMIRLIDRLDKLSSVCIGYCSRLTAATLEHVVKKLPGLVWLDVSGNNWISPGVLEIIHSLEYLTGLNIGSCINLDPAALDKTINSLLNLNFLRAYKNGWLNDHALRSIPKRENLRLLDIAYCQNVTPETLRYLEELPRLGTLDLSSCGWVNHNDILEQLLKLVNLKRLHINNCPLPPFPLEKLHSLSNLEALGINSDPLFSCEGVLPNEDYEASIRRFCPKFETIQYSETPLHYFLQNPNNPDIDDEIDDDDIYG